MRIRGMTDGLAARSAGGGSACLCSAKLQDLRLMVDETGAAPIKLILFCAAGAQQTHIIDEAQTSVTSLTVPTRRIRDRHS